MSKTKTQTLTGIELVHFVIDKLAEYNVSYTLIKRHETYTFVSTFDYRDAKVAVSQFEIKTDERLSKYAELVVTL